ncbi:Spy/CpxP family protein refolding chaperone [Gemmatimonas sp.]|uniref:Spy/CpxP family protein refolding chaperone n=1 Tax=Gemmatimonas sp. TaxID=1962908 RepID=UPI003983B719
MSAFVPSLLVAQAPPSQRSVMRRAPRPRAAAPIPGAADPSHAQSGPGAHFAGPGSGGGPGSRGGPGGGHPAAMLLRARTPLELTDAQVKRLEALQAAPAPKSNATDMMRAQADLLDATQGDGNLAGARAALDKLSRLRNEQMLTRLATQQDVRAVLTSAQKTKVDNMRQQRRGRAGADRERGMRQGGMRPRGMRQGGIRKGGPVDRSGPCRACDAVVRPPTQPRQHRRRTEVESSRERNTVGENAGALTERPGLFVAHPCLCACGTTHYAVHH